MFKSDRLSIDEIAKLWNEKRNGITMGANNNVLHVIRTPGSQIDIDRAKKIVDLLKRQNGTLHELSFHSTQIGATGAIELADMMKHDGALKKLYLYNNLIGDVGAEALAEVLGSDTTLIHLSLIGNNIRVEGAKSLAKALRKNKTLERLNLEVNHFGTAGFVSLAAAMLKHNVTICDLFTLPLFAPIHNLLERNRQLKWPPVAKRMLYLFNGLYIAFGNDVYTHLIVLDRVPYYALLDRAYKVALLQSFIDVLRD